ncbi:AraC family transcriptional regulator [Litoribrevibacter albus]|uniref:AraC family transcriptional regulator n=1 Tax=Litoribrevibacter albus TaxID=1473156 RepID=A0AA37S7U2_9GAMM|nr:AraC family transcriptional regulator [Litoribrevibacter albus]GLQ29963.1 AraC family transcriptional regulator [Litoribrevibacter albus]
MEDSNAYTTISAWALAVSWTLKAEGVSAESVFEEAGLDLAEQQKNPAGRIPVQNMTRLWNASVKATGNPAFGLKVSEHVHAMHFKALGMLTVTSESVAKAFEKIISYYSLVSDSVIIDLQYQPDVIGFSINENEGVEISLSAIDAFFSVILKYCQNMMGNVKVVRAVDMKRPTPDSFQPWQEFYGCPIRFNQVSNVLWLERALLEQPSIHYDEKMALANEHAVQDYLRSMNAHTWVHKCKLNIQFASDNEPPTLASLAKKFKLSERTLARKLKEEGASFSQVLQEKKQEVACYYLTQTTESIVNIALNLGFNDTSNFNRAFQRWFQMTPSEYRQTHRSPED